MDIDLKTSLSPNEFDWTLSFEHRPNIQAYAYWSERSAGRRMPLRSDLDPRAMRQFTSHVGLVELRPLEGGNVDYFIRRAGSKWEEVYGPMTGKLLADFLPSHIQPAWREAFGKVREAGTPVRLTAQVDFLNKNWLQIEMLIAPLGEGDVASMLFTSFVAWSKSRAG